jgi:hypothetical protein
MENWMITSYEVEFGPKIGSGGLWVLVIDSLEFYSFHFSPAARFSRETGIRLRWHSKS